MAPYAKILINEPLAEALAPMVPRACIASLNWNINGEATYPSIPEFRKRLKSIEDAARLLRSEMADLWIQELLLNGDRYDSESEIAAAHWLVDYANRASKAVERAQGSGNRKLYPEEPSGPNPTVHCALIAGLAWGKVNGKWPGKSCADAQELCYGAQRAAIRATSSALPAAMGFGVRISRPPKPGAEPMPRGSSKTCLNKGAGNPLKIVVFVP